MMIKYVKFISKAAVESSNKNTLQGALSVAGLPFELFKEACSGCEEKGEGRALMSGPLCSSAKNQGRK